MPQYLVAIHLPDNYDPSLEDEAVIRDVHALNEEMDAASVRLFAGGLEPASKRFERSSSAHALKPKLRKGDSQ